MPRSGSNKFEPIPLAIVPPWEHFGIQAPNKIAAKAKKVQAGKGKKIKKDIKTKVVFPTRQGSLAMCTRSKGGQSTPESPAMCTRSKKKLDV